METTGHVSLWLGSVESESKLKELTRTSYSEDGDFEGSQFSRAFEVGFFNEACMEVEYFATPSQNLGALLKGFSNDAIVIPRFLEIAGTLQTSYNAVILFYDLRHEGKSHRWETNSGIVDYVGAVRYEN